MIILMRLSSIATWSPGLILHHILTRSSRMIGLHVMTWMLLHHLHSSLLQVLTGSPVMILRSSGITSAMNSWLLLSLIVWVINLIIPRGLLLRSTSDRPARLRRKNLALLNRNLISPWYFSFPSIGGILPSSINLLLLFSLRSTSVFHLELFFSQR